MAEYIERSDAAEYFEKSNQTMWHKDDVVATISSKSNIHAADVAEVVRCKDCVFCKCNEDANVYKCDRRGYFTEYVNPDIDYCSKGERRSENARP